MWKNILTKYLREAKYIENEYIPVNCGSLNTVLAFLLRQCFKAFRDISLADPPNNAWWNGIPKKRYAFQTEKRSFVCICYSEEDFMISSVLKKVKKIF